MTNEELVNALIKEANALAEKANDLLNCCQFRPITKESISIVNHCSNMG